MIPYLVLPIWSSAYISGSFFLSINLHLLFPSLASMASTGQPTKSMTGCSKNYYKRVFKTKTNCHKAGKNCLNLFQMWASVSPYIHTQLYLMKPTVRSLPKTAWICSECGHQSLHTSTLSSIVIYCFKKGPRKLPLTWPPSSFKIATLSNPPVSQQDRNFPLSPPPLSMDTLWRSRKRGRRFNCSSLHNWGSTQDVETKVCLHLAHNNTMRERYTQLYT